MEQNEQENTEQPPAAEERAYCPNCDRRLPKKVVFCPKCGQKQVVGRIKMSDMLLRLWNTTFHLENRFLRMVWHLLLPGKVTDEYFKGRIKRYPHPIQFFLLCVFFLLLFLSRKTGQGFNIIQIFGQQNTERLAGKLEMSDRIRQNIDSLPPPLRTAQTKTAVDSLLRISMRDADFVNDTFHTKDIMLFGSPLSGHAIPYRELIECTPDSVLKKYPIEQTLNRVVFRQFIKAARDSQGVSKFWLGMMAWIILSLIVVMALWLKMLYIRRNRYVVEHFVLLLHHHSGFIFLTTVIGFGRQLLHYSKNWVLLAVCWLLLGWWWAMWRFYGQSKRKTTLKWFIFWVLYFFSLLILFLISLAISVLFF